MAEQHTAGEKLSPAQKLVLARIIQADADGLNTFVRITNPSAAALARRGLLVWERGGSSGYGRWEPSAAGLAAIARATYPSSEGESR